MVEVLLLVGLGVAVFVGFNVGGSNTGVAFGPAVGSRTISPFGAALLMSVFSFLGGWTVGRNVVETMGGRIVPASLFTVEVSIAVLFFIGVALFLSNVVGVPASTSMTGVGAIAGLGIATDAIDWAVMGQIVSWWLVSPVVAFWVSAVLGRYLYPTLQGWFAVTQTEGALLRVDRSAGPPWVVLGPGTTPREVVGTATVVVIGCYTAFSAGASNTANAIAPLVGNGAIGMNEGLLLAGGAIALGAFTIARRTMDTMGNELTDMPLLAALVVAVVSSSLVTVLSEFGIPASIVIIATMSIVGLGWGRATRIESPPTGDRLPLPTGTEGGTAGGDDSGAGAGDGGTPTIGGDDTAGAQTGRFTPTGAAPSVAGEGVDDPAPAPGALFQPWTTARVIALQNVVPAIATVSAYLLFRLVLPPG